MTDQSASALKTMGEDSAPVAEHPKHAKHAKHAEQDGPIEHAKQAIKDAVEKVVEKLPGDHTRR